MSEDITTLSQADKLIKETIELLIDGKQNLQRIKAMKKYAEASVKRCEQMLKRTQEIKKKLLRQASEK